MSRAAPLTLAVVVCATAYWYQELPSPRWPPLEPYAERIEDLGQ